MPDVQIGQVWMSNDKRSNEATRRRYAFRVIAFVLRGGVRYACVEPLDAQLPGARARYIAVHRFKQSATGYVMVVDGARKAGAK